MIVGKPLTLAVQRMTGRLPLPYAPTTTLSPSMPKFTSALNVSPRRNRISMPSEFLANDAAFDQLLIGFDCEPEFESLPVPAT